MPILSPRNRTSTLTADHFDQRLIDNAKPAVGEVPARPPVERGCE